MPFSITTLSKKGLFVTLSINDFQHNRSAIMLNVIMPSIVMLSVIVLNVVMLNVVVP